jgi:GT2 family glycosyltransferase
MQASFIIPIYNCLDLTRECLRTLEATLPTGLEHEIILVDDGSTDGTREWLATLPAPCRALQNDRNLGFAGTCNRGAEAAEGDLLFFLNNDLVFLPGWFEPMRSLLAVRRDAGLVGNIQLNARTGALDHAGIRFDHKAKPEHDQARPWLARIRGWRTVPAVTGACFGISRSLWLQLGGLNPTYRNGGEDIDLAFRARALGRRNYVALRSVVRHHISASVGRKLRDEENSRRLATAWQRELALLAAPAWSRHYITTVWEQSPNFDDRLGREALCAAMHLGRPGSLVLDGVDLAFAVEFERWRELLDGVKPAIPLQARPISRPVV